jgi:hypothetical protein
MLLTARVIMARRMPKRHSTVLEFIVFSISADFEDLDIRCIRF